MFCRQQLDGWQHSTIRKYLAKWWCSSRLSSRAPRYFFFLKKREEEYCQSRIVTRHSRMYIYLSYSGDRRREVIIRFESTYIIILKSHMGIFCMFSFYKFYEYIRHQATLHEFRFTEFIPTRINKVASWIRYSDRWCANLFIARAIYVLFDLYPFDQI